MKRLVSIFLFALLGTIPQFAQKKDFLSESEIEKIREVQEPNERLKLYLLFARTRMDQIQQQLAKEKKGRSLEVRTLLDEYEQIIEAIDNVSNDALKRKTDIQLGINAVSDAETKFTGQLQKIKDSSPRDLDMYSVELTEAIATTRDSIELAAESIGSRTDKVTAEAEQEKKEVKSISEMERKATGGQPATENAGDPGTAAAAPAGTRRKPPTLLKDGEKLDDVNQPPSGKTPKPPPL
jgi:hypothetical protein